MPATPEDVKVERYKFWGLILTAVLGPVLAFYLAKSNSDVNHAQSAKGYEALALMTNQHEQRLDNIEKTLQRIELQTKAASQPASISLNGPLILPGGRVDAWPHVGVKAPRLKLDKTVVTVNPKYAEPPASLPAKASKAKPAALRPLRQVPARLRDVR